MVKIKQPEYQQCRLVKPMPQSTRRAERRGRPNDVGKHTRFGPEREPNSEIEVEDEDGELVKKARLALWHTTKTSPWRNKQRRRAAAKRAREARKINRGR